MNKEKIFGIGFIGVLSVVAWFLAKVPAVQALSISSLIVGILLGMVYANLPQKAHVPDSWFPGLKYCSKTLLRVGIVLYGFRLTFQDVVAVGPGAIVVDVLVVTITIFLGIWLGRLLGVDKETALLTATGSAVCGAAAVLGAEAVVKPESHKTAVAVSTVVIFGTLLMFLYPVAYRAGLMAGLTDLQAGIYTGSTLHEVAHVVGAGNAMGEDLASVALITKMVRVILLVFVLLTMSWALARGKKKSGESAESKITVPWFAFLFLGMIAVNSFMVASLPESFMSVFSKVMNMVSTFLLTMAMTALGADTSFSKFKQAGAKPFALAAILCVWLVAGGYLMARFIV